MVVGHSKNRGAPLPDDVDWVLRVEETPPLVSASDEEEDFDWDEDEDYSREERSRMEKLYESTLSEVKENEIVAGTVVSITPKEVLLNIGFKSEGVVQTSEFRDLPAQKFSTPSRLDRHRP